MKRYKNFNLFFTFFICTLLYTLNVKSQDLIYLKNDTIKCKIIKDKVKFLEYKLENDTNIYRIYQDQYDFYVQHTENQKKQEYNILNNKSPNNPNKVDTIKSIKKDPSSSKNNYPKTSIGIGLGLDYGGIIGGRVTLLPIQNISFFLGFGYNMLDAGINVGAFIRLAPNSRVCPFVGGMYGYNSVILIKGTTKYSNKVYYGPSISVGLEFRTRRLKNYISASVIIPFRSKSFENDMNTMKQDPNIIINTEPSEALISFGYHFVF